MQKEAVVASALSVRFSQQTVLDKIDFTVKQGEVFALLGGNGAGKSTALKTFLGTVPKQSGEAKVLGMSVDKDIDSIRAQIAYLQASLQYEQQVRDYHNALRLFYYPLLFSKDPFTLEKLNNLPEFSTYSASQPSPKDND
ncbi:ATP-binding cassette domain-containing protein [Shewanella basaltis]|uniref:ATP-binding cassette domain-containing protein n=1 Tax=Shewanella basaltis TaxID=472183 RepID=UPI0024B1FFA0|nr:ATP-binding cassette domain-containing protein [Shewanella basaltis]